MCKDVTVRGSVNLCFFKQKTAYDMSISDWSSDVCPSDLTRGGQLGHCFIEQGIFVRWSDSSNSISCKPGLCPTTSTAPAPPALSARHSKIVSALAR